MHWTMVGSYETLGLWAWVLLLLALAVGLLALAVARVDRGLHGRFAFHPLAAVGHHHEPKHAREVTPCR